jgi:cytochrome c1
MGLTKKMRGGLPTGITVSELTANISRLNGILATLPTSPDYSEDMARVTAQRNIFQDKLKALQASVAATRAAAKASARTAARAPATTAARAPGTGAAKALTTGASATPPTTVPEISSDKCMDISGNPMELPTDYTSLLPALRIISYECVMKNINFFNSLVLNITSEQREALNYAMYNNPQLRPQMAPGYTPPQTTPATTAATTQCRDISGNPMELPTDYTSLLPALRNISYECVMNNSNYIMSLVPNPTSEQLEALYYAMFVNPQLKPSMPPEYIPPPMPATLAKGGYKKSRKQRRSMKKRRNNRR